MAVNFVVLALMLLQGCASCVQAPGVASSACFDSLAAHLGELGITGQGLETAAQGSPLVGPFIGVPNSRYLTPSAFPHTTPCQLWLLTPYLLRSHGVICLRCSCCSFGYPHNAPEPGL